MQQVHAVLGGASPRQKRRGKQGGGEGTQLLLDHLKLQRKVTAKGGVPATEDQPAINHSCRLRFRQGRFQGLTNTANAVLSGTRSQRPRVGEQKEQR